MDTVTSQVQDQPPVFGPPAQVQTAERRPNFDEIVQVKHLHTDGLYVKAYQAPAGTRMYTKQFATNHMTILARGTAVLEAEGQGVRLVAPVHCVIPANTRVRVSLLEDSVWYCLHPTAETDIERLKELF